MKGVPVALLCLVFGCAAALATWRTGLEAVVALLLLEKLSLSSFPWAFLIAASLAPVVLVTVAALVLLRPAVRDPSVRRRRAWGLVAASPLAVLGPWGILFQPIAYALGALAARK